MNLIDKVWVTKLQYEAGLITQDTYFSLLNVFYSQVVRNG